VITRLHIPDKRHRINKIIQRILSMPDMAAQNLMAQIIVIFPDGTKTSGTFLSGT
jgi:hypothetical protein